MLSPSPVTDSLLYCSEKPRTKDRKMSVEAVMDAGALLKLAFHKLACRKQ